MKPFSYEEATQPAPDATKAFSYEDATGKPPPGKGFLGQARDLGLAAARGAIAVPEVAVGAADILSGGRAGKALENQGGVIGFRPKQAKEFLSSLETDQTKAQRQEFADADGVLGKAGVALSNPSLIANTVVESAPTMLAGGLVGRGVKALGMTGSTAAAIGEGAVMAGSAAEQMRQQTDDGLLTGKQTALALGTGAVGAAVGAAGNRLGQAFGDADTVLVNGIGRAAGATTAPTRGMAARVLGGSAVEGAEEVAQSVPEQMFQNAGLSRSLDEGVADAAVMGALSGGVMGAGAGVMSGRGAAPAPTAQPGQEPAVQAAPESQPPAPAPDPLAAGFTPGAESEAAPQSASAQAAGENPIQQGQTEPAQAAAPENADVRQGAAGSSQSTSGNPSEQQQPFSQNASASSTPLNSSIVADQAVNAEAAKRANRLAAVGVAEPMPNSPLTNAALAAVDSGVHGIAMAEQQAAATSPASAAQAEKPVGQQNAPTQAPLSSAAALAPLAESVAAPAPTPQQRLATLQTEIASGTDAQTGAKLNAMQVGFRKAEARQIKQPPESETLAIGQSRATQPTQQPTQQDPAYVPELQNPSQKASPAPGAQAAQSVAPAAPPQELTRAPEIAAGPARVLQNRDRSSVASIAQMNEIAAKPDYWRAGQSRVMENGAPVVFGSAPANALVGKADQIADGLGKRVPVQYAVVESADVLPSHQADGAPIAEYQNGMPGKLRAVAGNGRAAGIGEAYRRNTAVQYRQDLTDDAADLGIDPVAVRAMKAPVLVRVMPEDQVTDDIGDRSNIGGTAALSATEQAANDARRIDLSGLTFDDNGIPDRQSAAKFVNTMPVSERGTMMQPDGSPTRQLIDRITSAAFKAAYGNDDVVRLQAQSTDPEVRNIITAMASAAGQMAGLEGAGDFDIRGAVAEAAQMAVNAKRQGITLTDYLNNADITFSGEAFTVARFMADNIRSAKRMAEGLRAWANYAAEQVAIVRENEYQNAMFGATPTASRGDTFNQLGATNDQSSATQIQDGGNRVSRVADRAPRQAAQPAPEQNRPADSQEKPSQQDSAEKITQPEPAYVPQLQGAKQEKSPAPSAQTQQDTAPEIDANGKAVEQIRTAELTYNTTKRLAAAYHGEAYKGKSEDYKTLRADLEERASDENFKGKSLAQDVLERFDDSIANLEQKQAAKKAEAPEGRRPAQEISIAPAAPEASPSTPAATPARPATWRKNYIQARAVAKSLGITPVKGVQLPGLLAEIDRTDSAARADPAAESAQDVANQAPAQTAPVPKSVSAKAQAANENKAKAAELREFNKEWRKKNKVGKFDTWEEMDKFRTARQESRDSAAAALKKGTEELKADFAKFKEQRETARAKAAALDTLTAPTPQDILDQQARTEAAAQTEKSQQRAADERARRERERKDIAKASTAAADTFELGGNAEQNLSGQQSVFDAPAEQAPAPKSKEVNNAREYGVQSAKISGRREAKDKKVQKYNAEEYAAYLEGFDAQTAADNARFERSKNNPNATTFPTANNLDMAAKFKAQDEARNAPTPAPKPAKQPNVDKLRAEADLMNALADLGDIFSKPFKSHLTDEQTQKLMPVMTRLLDAAFRLGYIKFKDAAKFALDKIQAAYGDEVADAITLDHLQGAYIGMAGGKVGADTKRAVIDIEDKAEITAHTLTEPTEDDVPESPTTAPTPAPSQTLTQSLATAIEAGNMPKDNPALKKLAESFDGQPADQARMKQAQEELETAIAMTARKVVSKNEGDRSTFDALLRMYESQPNLNVRTSTSIANQAYSTPAPLAFLASRLAGITSATVAHEPTAGTGMLLIGANPKKAIVNELNDLRIGALEAQGFTPTQKDAATQQLVPTGARVDAVITNPPFGPVKDDAGKPTKIKVDGFNIGQIDHLIAARALEAMKQDGKATLILGANKATGGLSTDDRIFFNWLYANYNVTGHFEVNGDLYTRQGAGWPVRVISINGRMKSGKFSPVAGTIQRADNWSEVYEKFTQSLKATNAPIIRTPDEPRKNPASVVPAPAPTGASRPQSGTASTGNVAGTSPRVVPDRAEPTAEPVGAGADEQRLNAQSYIPEPQPGAKPAASTRPAKPAGVAALDDAPKGNDFQLPYTTRSSRKDEGVLIPANMAQPTQDALSRLEDEVGDIDEFARKELGYKTVDELHGALMGLQVDSVATTIWQIKRGKAVVIADQTGIGKGRQAASIIRWAAKQGMTPVFVSVKPSLFTDMYGDLADIGTSDINPFILNGNAWIAGEDGTKLFANKPATHKAALREIMDSGELPGDSNALFMTYSQINVENMQRGVLRALAPNAVFVLDESHNAAGASATGQFMIETLGLAKGVSYLSATYAKRPDNMPLYFKTDIGDAAADAEGLSEAMAAGGLSLQTVVSNNLVKAGQMFRRERSYDGVSIVSKFDTPNRALHERMSNEATKALRAIVSADKSFHSIFVKNLSKELASEGSSIKDIAGNQASASVQHTEFSSVVHNFVKQMLLGLKAQTAADEAIASLKRGEKPVIAVENTMGSFLNEYAASNNIAQGASLGSFDYRTVLSRALERTRVVVVTDERGNDEKRIIPLSELDFFTAKAYQDAADVIDGLKLSIPVSPIDWMRAEIIRAGFSVAEITGRNLSVDYSDPKKPVLAAIEQEEQKDKVNTTRLFNSGKLDALILNVAGSTGISLHASEKFEDQRQRHMIVAQAAGDINIFMQMIGRVHRTGQVRLPKYSILSVDLPTEKRPTAVLSVKMKSLNANTSSNTESATSVKTADILNKYGDQIVQQYLSDNLELARALGLEDEIGGDTIQDDIARKATGRLALQPIETQHAFYDDAEAQYAGLIEYLNKTNQNDLEPRTFDFDAKETRQEVLFEGPDKSTPFGEDAIYGEYSIKAQGHPMKPEEIRAAMTENLNGLSPEQHIIALVDPLKTKFDAYRKTLSEGVQQETASQALIDGQQFMQSHRIGSTFRVDINGEPFNAVVINIRNSHKEAGNPFSLSKMQLTVAVNGALRSLTIPATQFKKIEVSTIAPFFKIEQLFKEQPANQRETAKIVTGNLLAAYGEIKGARGTIITFTKQDGTSEQGILLPKLFDYGKNTRGDYRLPTAQSALLFLQTSIDREIGRFGIASRDSVVRVIPHAGWGIRVQVPKSKLKGGKFFLDSGLIEAGGDFVSSGNIMVQTVTDKLSAIKVLDLLMKKQALYALPSMADEAKAAVDKKINLAFSRDPKSTTPGMTPAQVQAIADKISAGWTNAPQIVVAANMADQRIPQAARDEDQRQRAMGATGSPEGFVHAGKVYLLADQLTSPERAAEVLMHEALGHIGLQGVFGDGLKTILQQIATMRRADVTRKAEQYGLDMNNAADRLTAAEEVLAEMAQTQPEIGFVKRAVAAIRNWLRANVPGIGPKELTDNDIIQAYLLPARGWVERGAAAGVGGRAAFSRGDAEVEINAESIFRILVDADDAGGQNGVIEMAKSIIHSHPELRNRVISEVRDVGYESAFNIALGESLNKNDIPLNAAAHKTQNPKLSESQKPKDLVDHIAAPESPRGKTNTPAFRKWFGDSEVIDADGNPLVVYHGTNSDFNVFYEFSHFGTEGAANDRNKAKGGSRIIPVYLRIENPLRIDDSGINSYLGLLYEASRSAGLDVSYDFAVHEWANSLNEKQISTIGRNVFSNYESSTQEDLENYFVAAMTDGDIQKAEDALFGGDVRDGDPLGDHLPFMELLQETMADTEYDGFVYRNKVEGKGSDSFVVLSANQIKSADSNSGAFDPANPDIRFSRSPAAAINARLNDKPETTLGDTGRYDEAQIQAMRNTGMTVTEKSIAERTKEFWQDTGKKLAQGLADQFAPIKEISKEAYGLARLAKGASGAFEALLQGGKLKLTDGVYDFDEAQRGGVVETLLKPMNGEHHDALRWVAANRAEQLMNESEATRAEGAALLAQASALNQQARALESAGKIPEAKKLRAEAEIKKSEGDKKKNVSRENLFTRDDIAALKRLSDGDTSFDYTIQNGIKKGIVTRNRAEIYKDFNSTLNGFNRNVLDLTEKSGLIDPESRKVWERDFYVPFYRVSEDDGGSAGGANVSGSMVRQKAFERLKGGKQKLSNDLLDNVLMNWAHLLDASAKNRAAKATLEAAAAMPTPVAIEAPESTARSIASEIGKKNSVVWFMDSGKQRYFIVDDPYVLTAITALEYAGMKNPVMNAMGAFKHALTVGVTASPFFKIRNLIRDSLQVVASAPLDYNVAKNIKQGFALTNPRSDAYFRLLAGGGTIHFGTMMEGSEGKRVQSLVESGVKESTILNGDHKIKAFYQKYIEPGVTAYNELGNRGEAINRAALYDQLVKKGVSHADASLQARDLMDFSMQGSFTAVRFLTQVVPFMNARIQGLYKLGRAANEDPRRMAVVLGATAAFSVALMTAYSDDDDWKKREEFDRNNFWWFKFGGEAFRIPKPFEIGAMATLAERGFELAFSKEMTSKRFMEQVRTLLSDNLSMNPIPQMFKPVIDVYANKDSFSGRPIEGMGMDKLRPEYRFSDRTSMLARGASSALNAAAGVFDKDSLSPVQIDHMLRGYFGWLGSFVVGTSEIIARPATNQPTQAAPDYWKMATGGIASTLDGAQSRYVSSMYEQASRIEQDYGTWRAMIKEGKPLEAQEYRTENAASIGKYHRIEAAKKQTATLNQQIKIIERGNASSTEKRERITALRNQQNLIAKMAMSTE